MVTLRERLRDAHRPPFGWVTVRIMLLLALAWVVGLFGMAVALLFVPQSARSPLTADLVQHALAALLSFMLGRYWIRRKPLGQAPSEQYWLAAGWFMFGMGYLRWGDMPSLMLGLLLDLIIGQALLLSAKGTLRGEMVGHGPITPPSPQG